MLGLVAWFSIAAQMTVYCAELNALLHHRLWPRGMVQPPLTKADQELAALQATTSQFRPEVEVHVTVKGRPMSQQEYLRTGQRPRPRRGGNRQTGPGEGAHNPPDAAAGSGDD